ncbi:MAG: hypothetical protein JNM49_10650 [Flavobacteriales bacterium]|nr:hypothetical protein [Flavobacteriales bacterium]
MKRADLLSILLLSAAIGLGAAREFIFVNLNYQLDFLLNQRTVNYAHSVFRAWADHQSADQLLRAKWAIAAGFVLLTMALTIALAWVRLGGYRWTRTILLSFLALGALALTLHALSTILPAMYHVSIALLHGLQYPVPLLIVWMMSWLHSASRR